MDLAKDLLRDLGLRRRHGLDARELLRTLGAAQDGQFATRQATVLELKPSQIHALRDSGEITWVRQSIWRFRALAESADPAIMAFLACWPHAVISHGSAAMYHQLGRVAQPKQPDVTIPYGRTCRPAGVAIHRSTSLDSADIVRIGPLRYLSLARTVCDLATRKDPWGSLSTLDDAIAQGASRRWIHQRAAALSAGRNGVALIARATHPNGASEFRSWLERAAAHVFRLAGLPAPQWNVAVRDDRGRIGIVDALWPQWRVIAELEGLRFHTSPAKRKADAQRFNRLNEADYSVRRFTWDDLVQDPAQVSATLARALSAAGASVNAASVTGPITLPRLPFL